MDDTQQLDCTQSLVCDQEDEEEEDDHNTHHLVAWLEVNGSRYEVFSGKNIIGRDPDRCKIVIPSKVLSKQHAVVEVRTGTHTLADLGSSNKTRVGKMMLRPHVQYALQGGEKIRFGNVMATYTIKPEEDVDSGSETGSESMLPMIEDEEERSPSPVLSSRSDYSDSHRPVQNGINGTSVPVTSVSSQNSHTPQANALLSSHSVDKPIPALTDSLLQPSDGETSVVSATQSPPRKNSSISPSHTHKPDVDEYNSDASTDAEDNSPAQFCHRLVKAENPVLSLSITSIPETPPHSSHNTSLAVTPVCSSSNISIPETPAASSPSPSKIDTSPFSLSITSIPETQSYTPLSTSLSSIPTCHSPIATGDIPTRTQKDDHSEQGADLVFKKPLALSTVKAFRSSNSPAGVACSPKSSAATKVGGAVSTRLFSADNSDDAELDASTNSDTNIDLDAPTQVFTGDTSVDLDAPTQVFTGNTSVDLDAPTQVFTSNTSVDLDAPTQVFTGDTSVDLDAPTQVFTGDTSVDLDAPTQVFTGDTSVDLDAPTQVFTGNTSIDLDAPTQVFTTSAPSDADLDAPTQVFTNDTSVNTNFDAPTQVFTNDTSVNTNFDAPTQVFTTSAPSDVDLDAPTQVFTGDTSVDLDAPTQVFDHDTSVNINFDAPTQVFTKDAPCDIDPDAPTQVFNKDAPCDIDPDVPTQVFTRDAPCDIDPDALTQVFTKDAPCDIDPDAPTQVFTRDAPCDIDPDAPTQVFTKDAPCDIDPDVPTQVFTRDAPCDIDPDAPTQVFTRDAPFNKNNMEDKLDTTVRAVASSTTPGVSADDDHIQELATNVTVKDNCSQASTQLSHLHEAVKDDPLRSGTLLQDTVNADDPTQPFLDTCKDVPGPSNSIMVAWGHLESKVSVPSVLYTDKEDLEESDNASDVSKSLFNDEDEADSLHGERETGVFDNLENDHGNLKGDDYHSDESTDLEENTLIDSAPQTNHKVTENTETSPQKKDPNVKCYTNKKTSMMKVGHNQSLEGDYEEAIQSPATSSNSCREESSHSLTGQNIHFSTKNGRQPRQIMPSKSFSLESSQESVPINVSLSDCFLEGSEENSESVLATTTCKKGTELPDWLSDSESEDAYSQSPILFDLPHDTEGYETQKRGNVLSSPNGRKSTRLVFGKGSTQKKKQRGAPTATPASCPLMPISAATKHVHTQISVPTSQSPASSPISTPAHASITTATISTTPTSITSTPMQPSVPVSSPVPSLALAPTTRRQTRRSKTDMTSTSSAIPDPFLISTRRRGKRSTLRSEVQLASTTINTVITSTCPTTAASSTTVTTTSSTDVITTTTVTTQQNVQPKRKTRSQRVIIQSALNTRRMETEVLSENMASPQPSTSGTADMNNSSGKTRSRRSKETTMPTLIKVKVEVNEDENVQMIPLTTIKQEKEEIETSMCEQVLIKTEPKDDLSQDNSGRCRRTRRRPERFSPERVINKPGRKSKSRMSLPLSDPSGRVLRENTGNALVIKTEERNEIPKNVSAQQRRSQRVLGSVQSRRHDETASVSNLLMKLKEEQKDSDEESLKSTVSSCTTSTPKADPPSKKSQQSKASNSRGTRQAHLRATKKIKIEVLPNEESDEGHLEDFQSRITQPRSKQIRISDCKKEQPTKRLSRNSVSKQKPKRSYPEASISPSSSQGSLSSRATRSNKDVELWSPSKRQRQASTKPRVLFTGYDDPADHKIVTDLGGRIVETPNDCTVLVAIGVKRTCKLLSAIGMGRPIVNPNWLTVSKTAGNFVDPWQFLLKDHEAEEKFGFCLEDTIKSASNFLLFEGLSMYATPSVQPPPCQMRDIVECAGGDYLHAPPRRYEPQIRIISCSEDRQLWSSFRSLGIPILGVEFILTGLLRHELLLEEFVLN